MVSVCNRAVKMAWVLLEVLGEHLRRYSRQYKIQSMVMHGLCHSSAAFMQWMMWLGPHQRPVLMHIDVGRSFATHNAQPRLEAGGTTEE